MTTTKRVNATKRKSVIYYLGNKESICQDIFDVLNMNAPENGICVDLFSGTGAVSRTMSQRGNVIAVDVQEYSRVLCSAMIEEHAGAFELTQKFLESCERRYLMLKDVYRPLLLVEEDSLGKALQGEFGELVDIVDHGCLLPEYRHYQPEWLAEAAFQVDDRREKTGLLYADDMAARYFGGTYYSYKQALKIAAIRGACSDMGSDETLLAGLLSAASLCASTIGGQLAQPAKLCDKEGSFKARTISKLLAYRANDIQKVYEQSVARMKSLAMPRLGNRAIRSECVEYLQKLDFEPAAIYADPPYSRYHYSRYYHVLETLALNDSPEITNNPATKQPSRGIYRASRYQSPFSMRTYAHDAFESLFRETAEKTTLFVLSYSPYLDGINTTPRMARIEELMQMARRRYSDVECRTLSGTAHSKLASSKDILETAEDAEVLLICRN